MLRYKYLKLIIAFLLPLQLLAQDITGVWEGEFYVDSTKKTYPFELSISENKGRLTGYSRIAFEEDGIAQVVYRDHSISRQDDKIIIADKKELSSASTISQPKEVRKTMIFILTAHDSSMLLTGDWSTNRTRRFLVARGTAKVRRKADFKTTELFKKLDELKLADELSFNKPQIKPASVVAVAPETTTEAAITLSKITTPAKPKETVIVGSDKIVQSAVVGKIATLEKPKDIVVAIPEKKAVPEIKPEVKTPAPAVVKVVPILKPKESIVAKVDKKPAPVAKIVVAKPAVKAPPIAIVKPPASKATAVVITPVEKIPAPVVAAMPVRKDAALEVTKRANSTEQSLFYKSDSLQLTLYDNGEIDGDTVSVLLNGKVIIAKQGLTLKPNVYTIYFDKNTPDSMLLVMYAENLGSIPPNTGLLVVHDGKSVYELRFSADLKNNAAIILRRKKDE